VITKVRGERGLSNFVNFIHTHNVMERVKSRWNKSSRQCNLGTGNLKVHLSFDTDQHDSSYDLLRYESRYP